jgi:DeoR/GlpR family transcriptional regulator of sugar metabolism
MGRARPPDAVVAARRERIMERVGTAGEVSIADLADELGVSLMTVHRDLDELAGRSLLRKLRGRASALHSMHAEFAIQFRRRSMVAEKEAIAAAAVELVGSGSTILLDDSTSCLPLAAKLADRAPLTVITNFLEVARIIGGAEGIEVLLLGGEYSADFDAVFGHDVHQGLKGIHADYFFCSAPAVTAGALYHPVRRSGSIKRSMLEASARHVLLADHTKFGRTAPFVVAHARDFDVLVTDENAPEEELTVWSTEGATVTIAPSADAGTPV